MMWADLSSMEEIVEFSLNFNFTNLATLAIMSYVRTSKLNSANNVTSSGD